MLRAFTELGRSYLIASLASVALALLLWSAGYPSLAQGGSDVGPRFRLVDQHNRSVDERQLANKPAVIHFGFTHCPVICPTTLFEISEYMRDLGSLADEIQFVFVTVDPERDTPELLRTYLNSFDPRIIGLSGEPNEINSLAKGLGANFTRQQQTNGSYTYDHTVFGYQMGHGWKKRGVLFMGTEAPRERVLNSIKSMIARASD